MSFDNKHFVPAGIPEELYHYINGKYVPSINGETTEVLDPVTTKPYAKVSSAQEADVNLAVSVAKKSFESGVWSKLKNRERANVLQKIADLVEKRADEIVEREVFDTGLVIAGVKGAAARAAENYRFFADLIVAGGSASYYVPGSQLNYVFRKPKGVAGLITPWNAPFMLSSWKLAPSLASGCSVVLKPASYTPLSAHIWGEIFQEAGLPDGVFNLVFGSGSTTGEYLVNHPDVSVISFTGDSSTGQHIYAKCAKYMKTMSMELGGKGPAVVFADAEFDKAVTNTLNSVMMGNGQRCIAGTRILVQDTIYDKFLDAIKAKAEAMEIGDPHDPKSRIGSMVHPNHFKNVLNYVEIGKSEARLLTGGKKPENLPEEFKNGSFLEPTIFVDVPRTARIFKEEIFGPVAAITKFSTEEEALELANDTEYGLAAYLWTSDLKRAHRFAQGVETGMIWVNSNSVRDLRMPFGGVKQSGLGHEGGYGSLDVYTDQEAIHIALD